MFQFVDYNVVALEIAMSPYLVIEVHPQKKKSRVSIKGTCFPHESDVCTY